MSFIGSMFSGSHGSGFQAEGATMDQANKAADVSNQGLAGQQAFLQALQGQNGIGNQSPVYNQLQGVANGTGPNPAQAMLNQATGQNVANQAALMAGQRGAGANTGLIARQAAQQGAATQQQAAGQGAAMQANQSLNALGQLGNLANQQVSQQAGATNAYSQAAQNEQQQLLQSIASKNAANAGIAQQNAKNQGSMFGGLLGGIGSIGAAMLTGGASEAALGLGGALGDVPSSEGFTMPELGSQFKYSGGEVEKYSNGGNVSGPKSNIGKHFAGLSKPMAQGGKVDAIVSPGEKYLSPEEARAVADGRTSADKVGKMVPGKAKVKGDSLKNDVVPAKLEEGGFVIPRSVMNSKDPSKHAAAFVRAHMREKGLGKK